MGRKHCARRWCRRGQYHSSRQVPAKSVASAMSGPSFSLFSDSQSLFSRNLSSSHIENTTENVELDDGKGNNINASSVDETPYQSLPGTNSEPVIGGVPVTDKGKGKVVEDSELGGSRRESVPTTETQPVDIDCSDDSQLNKKKIGVAPKKLKNITPTDDEKQLFDVHGLNFEIEVECTDSQPDSFQVFGTQLPKTQSMHESTGGDSQPTNVEVMKELQGLKLFVENKFEEVLAAIDRQSMKPEGNSAHKQQDNDPDFREMHNDYDQFERGHVGNDPVAIGDSTPKAPSMSGFCGVGRDGGATGVNMKNVTSSHGVVNDDLRSASRVDGVGQVDVGGSNVNLPSVSIEFYNQRSDIVVQNGLHMGKELTDPFEIEMITNLPTQQNSDCGVYVACFAEYIIEDLPIPVANFDVDGLRARFGILLWHYGRNKQLHGESSESEAPVAPKKTRRKKRKK
ncbi:hypothetical protein A4A49_13291 [Nicotiana attenuata]|uniref:Ubiquitin-like protease family profile domain-containing protein n=1 Tax=Nicotiana attenuata TaxID=49451 RepID=A0A1J6IZN0_NICAT|nr:hypothetical protein A4A49_13291 [Nicotiana attenuata]